MLLARWLLTGNRQRQRAPRGRRTSGSHDCGRGRGCERLAGLGTAATIGGEGGGSRGRGLLFRAISLLGRRRRFVFCVALVQRESITTALRLASGGHRRDGSQGLDRVLRRLIGHGRGGRRRTCWRGHRGQAAAGGGCRGKAGWRGWVSRVRAVPGLGMSGVVLGPATGVWLERGEPRVVRGRLCVRLDD